MRRVNGVARRDRYDGAKMPDAPETIPVVDLAPLLGGGGGDRRRVARAIARACETVGFFYLRGHGVDGRAIDAAHAQAKAFFGRPDAEKAAVAVTRERYRGYIPLAAFSPNDGAGIPDVYEGFKIHLEVPPDHPAAGAPLSGANVWPPGMPAFERAMAAYWDALTALADALLGAFALALGIAETTFAAHFRAPLSNISLLHYPPLAPDAGGCGIHAHCDSDAFTILLPDAVGGLEVACRDGRWIDAPALPGAFTVNIGNMMETWTDGRFVSTPHRVVNRSGRERFTIAYFAIPAYDVVVRPLSVRTTPGRGAARTPLHVGRFMEALYDSNWA